MNDLKTLTILFRATHTFHDEIKKDVKNYGLSLSEFAVLEALHHLGALSASTLKEKVLIAPSSMTYVMDQLENKGFVFRSNPKLDQRKVMLELTGTGRNLIETSYPIHLKNMREKLDKLSPTEEIQLQKLLKKIGKDDD
jgi:MarR family transcriptional regulator, 2-MHQ and catechol-resistance regulon repressor